MILFFEVFAVVLCAIGVVCEVTKYNCTKALVGFAMMLVADLVLLAVSVYRNEIIRVVLISFCGGFCTMAMLAVVIKHKIGNQGKCNGQ